MQLFDVQQVSQLLWKHRYRSKMIRYYTRYHLYESLVKWNSLGETSLRPEELCDR